MMMAAVSPPPDDDELVSAKSAAQILGISDGHLRQLRAQGRGPAFFKSETSKRVFYTRENIKTWLERDLRQQLTDEC